LVWVAEVESSFDRRALSPAGVVGLFQLLPDMAKRLVFPCGQLIGVFWLNQAQPPLPVSEVSLRSFQGLAARPDRLERR
jgi:soluble lytic murein transglycosylase-like protein